MGLCGDFIISFATFSLNLLFRYVLKVVIVVVVSLQFLYIKVTVDGEVSWTNLHQASLIYINNTTKVITSRGLFDSLLHAKWV